MNNDTETNSDEPRRGLEHSAVHLLHRAGQCAGDAFHSQNSLGDLTPRQYAVLLTVSRNEGLSQTDLVDATGIDRSTLADIVRRMLAKGLLLRQRTKQDARAYAVTLTDAGREVLQAAQPAADRVDESILSALPPDDRDKFLGLLNTIVGSMAENAMHPDRKK